MHAFSVGPPNLKKISVAAIRANIPKRFQSGRAVNWAWKRRFHMTSRQPYWCFQNNETAAMLVYSPVGVQLFSYVNTSFCSNKFACELATWVKTLYTAEVDLNHTASRRWQRLFPNWLGGRITSSQLEIWVCGQGITLELAWGNVVLKSSSFSWLIIIRESFCDQAYKNTTDFWPKKGRSND